MSKTKGWPNMYVLQNVDRFGVSRYYVHSSMWGVGIETTRDISQATKYTLSEASNQRDILFNRGTYFRIKKVEG